MLIFETSGIPSVTSLNRGIILGRLRVQEIKTFNIEAMCEKSLAQCSDKEKGLGKLVTLIFPMGDLLVSV